MKNYMCLLLFCICACFFAFEPVGANFPLSGRIFVIDAGHGGVDPGTVVGSIYEKDINLDISLALRDELTKLGAIVYMTREGDYDLGTPKATYRKKSDFDHRISYINKSKAITASIPTTIIIFLICFFIKSILSLLKFYHYILFK